MRIATSYPEVLRRSVEFTQYVSARYRAALANYGLLGSMSAPANPYDNAQAESFMKTLKVEEVYLGAYKTFADVAARLPVFIEDVYNAKRTRCIGGMNVASGVLRQERHRQKHQANESRQGFLRLMDAKVCPCREDEMEEHARIGKVTQRHVGDYFFREENLHLADSPDHADQLVDLIDLIQGDAEERAGAGAIGPALQLDDASAYCNRHRVRAVSRAKLFEYVLHMHLHGLLGDAKPVRHILVGRTPRNASKHLHLALAECIRRHVLGDLHSDLG